jgi:preprotein translocase subunit Sec61beta
MAASPLQPLAKAGLIALMALGSLVLWIGSPIGWLWIASQMQTDSKGAGLGPYMVVLIGIAVTAVALAKGLQWLNRLYSTVVGADEPVRIVLPWHRGLRGENEGKAPRTVLDVVMVISVSIGVVAFAIWFFFFAGSSLPGA